MIAPTGLPRDPEQARPLSPRASIGVILLLCLLAWGALTPLLIWVKEVISMLGLISPSTILLAALYLYVAVLICRAEYLARASWSLALAKALAWPVTAFNTVTKLYNVRPFK